MSTRPTITYETASGVLHGQYGTISGTRLGYLYDGICLGATFGWDGNGTGVGQVNQIVFDGWDEDRQERLPSAAFGYWVRDILRTMGVEAWEDLTGKPVITLWDGPSALGGSCKGIANPADDKVMVWDEWLSNIGRPIFAREENDR